jgi:hypothetical protein
MVVIWPELKISQEVNNMPKIQQPFKYFPIDTKDPIGKYTQPKPNDDEPGSGYPQEGIDNDDILVKGRWPKGTKKKERMEMRGYGAAEKGCKFMINKKRFSVEE